jgi:thymidylate synthase (FAD)
MTGMVTQKVHEHGYVTLLGVMGSDEDIVDAARISYDRQGASKDRSLIRYLMRHRHTSPFEMAVMKFEIKLPVFVARQWMRHRTGSFNEVSARYTQLPNEMFVPVTVNEQSTDNKQGRGDYLARNKECQAIIEDANNCAYAEYEKLLEMGVSREQARGVLPLNVYTKYVWKVDLHNLLHFINLRTHPHAQEEIQDYAFVIGEMVAKSFPLTYEAWMDYVKEAYTLSSMEVNVVHGLFMDIYDMAGSLNPELLAKDDTRQALVDLCGRRGLSERETKAFMEKFDVT